MKKILLFVVLLGFANLMPAQLSTPDSAGKEFQNVIMFDVTGLLTQFFGMGTFGYDSYLISYRRVAQKNAFRLGVGGNVRNSSNTSNDTTLTSSNTTNFIVGIGFEHYCSLSKRWKFYYGADAAISIGTNQNTRQFPIRPDERYSSKSESYGVAPLLGVIFSLNDRLALSTETSLRFDFTQSSGRDVTDPPEEWDRTWRGQGFETKFIPPYAINLRISF